MRKHSFVVLFVLLAGCLGPIANRQTQQARYAAMHEAAVAQSEAATQETIAQVQAQEAQRPDHQVARIPGQNPITAGNGLRHGFGQVIHGETGRVMTPPECNNGSFENSIELTVEDNLVCLTITGYEITLIARTPQPMNSRVYRVASSTCESPPIPLERGRLNRVDTCWYSDAQVTMWSRIERGCTPNNGILVPETSEIAILLGNQSGRRVEFAAWSFAQ